MNDGHENAYFLDPKEGDGDTVETLKRWMRAIELFFGYSLFEETDRRRILMGLVLVGGLGWLLVEAWKFSWPAFGASAILAGIVIAWFKELGSEAWRTWAMRVSTTVVAGLAVCAGVGASHVLDLTPYVDVSAITDPPKKAGTKVVAKKQEEPKKGSPEWFDLKFTKIEEVLDEHGKAIENLRGGKPAPKTAKGKADEDSLFNFDDAENVAKPAPKQDAKPKEEQPFKRNLAPQPKRSLAPPPPPDGEGLKLDLPGLPPLPGDEDAPIQKIDRSLRNEPKKETPKSAPKLDSPGNRKPIAIPRIAESDKEDAPKNASTPAKRILIGYDCDAGFFHPKEKLYQDQKTGALSPFSEDCHRHPDGSLCRCKSWRWKETGK